MQDLARAYLNFLRAGGTIKLEPLHLPFANPNDARVEPLRAVQQAATEARTKSRINEFAVPPSDHKERLEHERQGDYAYLVSKLADQLLSGGDIDIDEVWSQYKLFPGFLSPLDIIDILTRMKVLVSGKSHAKQNVEEAMARMRSSLAEMQQKYEKQYGPYLDNKHPKSGR